MMTAAFHLYIELLYLAPRCRTFDVQGRLEVCYNVPNRLYTHRNLRKNDSERAY